jgi:hypothetical protein
VNLGMYRRTECVDCIDDTEQIDSRQDHSSNCDNNIPYCWPGLSGILQGNEMAAMVMRCSLLIVSICEFQFLLASHLIAVKCSFQLAI